GATLRRSLHIPGWDSKGVVQAMDFLSQNNRKVDGIPFSGEDISAKGKKVIVIGGGDTGSDCIGTSIRQGAKSVINFEIMPKVGTDRPEDQPWPFWPMRLRTSSSHREGAERIFSISTKRFNTDGNGILKSLVTTEVSWERIPGQRPRLVEVQGSEKEWECDLVLLAMGFTGSETTLADQLGLEMDPRTNIKASTKDYSTNVAGVVMAGDERAGQSLIVWAITEGRQTRHQLDAHILGRSNLPLRGDGYLR